MRQRVRCAAQVRVVDSVHDVSQLCDGDPLSLWAMGAPSKRSQAWASDADDALAVAASDLSGRDRVALWAHDVHASVELVHAVMISLPASFRLLGPPELVIAATEAMASLTAVDKPFGWMECREAVPREPAPDGLRPRWLGEGVQEEIGAVLDAAFPESLARPGAAGVERWAGTRSSTGALAAVGAQAWSAPTVGFLAGLATDPAQRGRGLAREVCRLLTVEALEQHPLVALMVDQDNTAARRTYEGLGFTYRPLAAAHQT